MIFHELLITLQTNRLNMKKKLYILILLMVAFVLPSNAVLKEANLDTTLYMLRTELTNYHIDLEKQNKVAKAQQQQVIAELISIVRQADQNSIMLYSQRNGYVFDMTYACHEATEQFRKFKSKAVPFRDMIKETNMEVARYDSLINYLYGMNSMFLSDEAQVNRNVDLTLAVNIRRQLVEKQEQLQLYVMAYDRTDKKLKALNDYANKRYSDIQNSIFNNGGDNYLHILCNIGMNYNEAKTSVAEKYKRAPGMMSQWDVRIIFILFGIIAFYGHLRFPQSFCHPHRAHPTDEARYVPEQKGEFHGKTPLPHHGDDRGYLCSHPRHRTHDGYPELCGNGKPVAGGVCMADWRHSGINPATCG